jgi:hypothetical protein
MFSSAMPGGFCAATRSFESVVIPDKHTLPCFCLAVMIGAVNAEGNDFVVLPKDNSQ